MPLWNWPKLLGVEERREVGNVKGQIRSGQVHNAYLRRWSFVHNWVVACLKGYGRKNVLKRSFGARMWRDLDIKKLGLFLQAIVNSCHFFSKSAYV